MRWVFPGESWRDPFLQLAAFPSPEYFWKQQEQFWGCLQLLCIPGTSMENIQGKSARVAPEPEQGAWGLSLPGELGEILPGA